MKKIICLLSFIMTIGLSDCLLAQDNQAYQLSTHILDISQGKPASGVTIQLYKLNEQTQQFESLDSGTTDENGRIADFLSFTNNNEGTYKLKFETLPYFTQQGIESIYPYIEVIFQIKGAGHYHIPITVSANGYSTYRGN